ncbi:ADP-ribosylglycohydrolase family protein [Streptomyces sp. NPDC101166]|uniref:ADP-ribosylglycohydrolase family protein n=1 Tax=Streptomyces sp. NPDC101166 TaxID=3366120 RepID=UPI0037F65665
MARLAQLAPDATAPSALLGGLYVAASFPDRYQVDAALRFAAQAPDGDSVACVAGALLGAAHGAEALPVDLVSRHELAWVLDTLARDLVAQLTDSPSGGEYVSGWGSIPPLAGPLPGLVIHRPQGPPGGLPDPSRDLPAATPSVRSKGLG